MLTDSLVNNIFDMHGSLENVSSLDSSADSKPGQP